MVVKDYFAFGVALLLSQPAQDGSIAQLQLELSDQAANALREQRLETLRRSIPAARSLPLLECLARQRNASVVLDYLDGTRLALGVHV